MARGNTSASALAQKVMQFHVAKSHQRVVVAVVAFRGAKVLKLPDRRYSMRKLQRLASESKEGGLWPLKLNSDQ